MKTLVFEANKEVYLPLNVLCTFSDKFKNFIQSGNYEEAILDLMNRSSKTFPGRYEFNENQSNGECDFIEVSTGCKYDAKLPLNEVQGRLIGSRNGSILEWLKIMRTSESEFANCFSNRGLNDVNQLSLYKIMKDRLGSVNPDENIIFFFPYPIVLAYKKAIYSQFGVDILIAIYEELGKKDLIKNRQIFAIYPSIEKEMVLQNLATYYREYIQSPLIDECILYAFSIG